MIDELRLYQTLTAIHERLTPLEAGAIIDVARLAASADGRSSIDEMTILVGLRRMLAEFAGGQMPAISPTISGKSLLDLGKQLVPVGTRELAFACAFLVMTHDGELTTEEKQLVASLSAVLEIPPDRATELATEMDGLVRAGRA